MVCSRLFGLFFSVIFFCMGKLVFGSRDWAARPRKKKWYVPAIERAGYDESIVEVIPPVDVESKSFGRLQGKKRRNARAKVSA
jgi:hypothetical protein